mgnify:CR=1 FL=1
MLLPFYHRGMEAILPIGSRLPRIGNSVRVLFGAPTQVDDAWIDARTDGAGDGQASRQGVTQWCEETLAELTQYKLPQSTTGAIVSRRFTTWMPAGSNVYGPSGTRSVRFVLAGDQGFVIPDTMMVKFTSQNIISFSRNSISFSRVLDW